MSSVPQSASRPQLVPKDRLDSWKEIATYLGRGERTVQRWEREQGLPVHRLAHNKHSSVYAYTSELDAWRDSRRSEFAQMEMGLAPPAATWRRHALVFGFPAALICLAAVALWSFWPAAKGEWRTRPLTTFPGSEVNPTFSPDGSRVAYVWDGPGGDNLDVYAQALEGGAPVRLTSDAAMDISPAWSPDGRWIAFIRLAAVGRQDGLYVVPAIGGPERRIASLLVVYSQSWWTSPLLAWTPDGKYIAAGSQYKDPGRTGIVLASVDTGEVRPLAEPKQPAHYVTPAFSPDGKRFAFTRCTTSSMCNVFAGELSPGYALRDPRQLTFGETLAKSPVWSPDGRREILFASGGPAETRALSRVVVNGVRKPVREVHAAPDMQGFAISPRGGALVYARETYDSDLWRIRLPAPGARAGAPEKIIASTRVDISPDVSADGSRIVFASTRSGNSELWVADRDGGNPTQLTRSGERHAAHPRWSPDGTRIVYMLQGSEGSSVCVVRSSGGAPDCLTDGRWIDVQPSWSHDGKSIYFLSHRTGAPQVWKMPAGGESVSPAVQLTKQTVSGEAQESWDGKHLYYTGPMPGVWRVPVGGGAEEPVPGTESCQDVVAVRDGLYMLAFENVDEGKLVFLPYGGRQPVHVADVPSPFGTIGASADGRTILFGKLERTESDLMLVEGLQ